MKINDIITETEINEKPMGLLKRAGLSLRSKLPGGAGAKAKLSVGKDANAMKQDLATWMDGSGIRKGTLSPDDFKNFLDQKGLPSKDVDVMLDQSRQASGRDENEPLSNPEVDEILKKVVQQGFKSQGAKGRQSKFAQTTIPAPPLGGGAGGAGGSSSLPSSVTSAISGLTSAQKAALKAML